MRRILLYILIACTLPLASQAQLLPNLGGQRAGISALTFLKIDRSLVMSVPTDPEDVAVIDAGIRFAEDLGLQVIAEGLEVEEQLRFLSSRGCVYGQGHLISAPLPAASVGSFLGRDWRAA